MKYKNLSLLSVMILMISACLCLQAAEQTVGLIKNDHGAYTGYTLFAPIGSTATYLIDMEGRIVNTWNSNYRPGQSAYLLEDGHLLRTASLGPRASRDFPHGGSGGRVEEFTWDGKLIWEFEYANEDHLLHHDIERIPNGNVLMIAWERKNAEKAMTAGRNPELLREDVLYPDHIIEVKPTYPKGGQIVWQWHVWDHLIQDYDPTMDNSGNIAEHPELLDINFFSVNDPPPGGADLNHINSIDYNPKLDQIVLSVHGTSEIWIIDHSTTTEQAAGHTGGKYGKGGDILYRWGNPQVYRVGTEQDQQFFRQHDAVWIEPQLPDAGNIMVFNNGLGRSKRRFSTVDIIVPPVLKDGSYISKPGVAFGPAKPVWSYVAQNKTDFFSLNISGAQRLPNGNTLICSGANGTFFEVTLGKKLVWKYINPVVNQGPGNGRPRRQRPPMSFDEQGPDRRPLPGGFGARGDRGRRPRDERGNFGPGSRQMPGAGQLRPRQRFNGQRPMNDGGMTAPSMEGPRNEVFRAYRYGPDYPGLKGKDLTPGKLLTELAQKSQIPEPAKQIDRIPKVSNGAKNRTVFVDAANVRGPWDGLSWKTAFKNVQDGINAAARPAGGEVWIAAGTYKPTAGIDRQISFQLKPGVSVFGGFKGSETKLDQRDYDHNQTILSGDIGRKDYLQDNSYHVVRGSDNAAIDGFIICNGYAVGNRFGQGQQGPGRGGQRQAGTIGPGQRRPDMSGPGQGRPGTNRMEGDMSRAGRAMPSFSQRRPGPASQRGRGGIHTTPQAIMQSSQQNSGAGMLNFQATPTIRNCTFQNNHADKGGAVYNMTSTQFPPRPNQGGPVVIFINCRFYGNTAKGRGGAISNDLGTAPVFLSCIFDSNRCDRKGGAIYNDFGCSPVIINCLFINNTAASAAGVGNDGSSNPVLYYCTFTSNTAEDFGPTLYQGTGPSNNPVLLNSVIWGNHCQWEGVGIYNWHDCQPVVKDSIIEGGYPGKGNSAKAPALDDSGIVRQDRGYRGADKRFTEKNLTALLKQLAPYRPTRPGGRGVHTGRSKEVKITGSDRIVYVNAQVHSSGNGETWKTAYQNLTDALADVKRDGAQIWLARGTYIPTGQDRSATFQLHPGTRIYGGFAGDETALKQRNPGVNVTILSGDIGEKEKREDNCYHVLIGANGAVLDGLTIRDGYADGVAYDAKGGGMILYKRAPQDRPNLPTTTGYSVEVLNCIFTANYARSGGAVYSYDRAKSSFTDCTFSGNNADNGGAVYDCVGSVAVYKRCRFEGNSAVWRGGAAFFDYGARPTIYDCKFIDNQAGAHGGSIFTVSRASQLENTTVFLNQCFFENNRSRGNGGAAAFHDNTIASVSKSTFRANISGQNGGAVSVTERSSLELDGNTFDGNKAAEEGDDIFRDLESIQGTYRKVTETIPAVELIGQFLRGVGAGKALWLLDSPVSNSGRLKTLIGELARKNNWDWEIKLLLSPDAELKKSDLIVASSDSVVLDGCKGWVNLATEIIKKKLPSAKVIDLSDED